MISVTGTGHVKYQENPLACKLHGNSAWKIYFLLSLISQLYILMWSGHVLIMWKLSCIVNDDPIFLSFGMYLPGQSSCHVYMAFRLLQNQASGHINGKKGTDHVIYMATPSHTNESVTYTEINKWSQQDGGDTQSSEWKTSWVRCIWKSDSSLNLISPRTWVLTESWLRRWYTVEWAVPSGSVVILGSKLQGVHRLTDGWTLPSALIISLPC